MAEACTLGQVIDHVGGKWSVTESPRTGDNFAESLTALPAP